MGKTTKWQSSWDSETDEKGDLFGDQLIKQDKNMSSAGKGSVQIIKMEI